MMLTFVLSIIFKMALYMIYANFFTYILTLNTYDLVANLPYRAYLDIEDTGALFDGGHRLISNTLINIMPLVTIALAAACAFLLNKVRPALRFVPIVLLPLSVYIVVEFPLNAFPAHNIGTALLLLLPWAYLILKILKSNFNVDAETMRRNIKYYATLAFAPLIILFFGGSAIISSIFYFQYVIIFAACAIGLLRIVRANEEMRSDPKFIAISIAPVAVTMLIILASQQIAGGVWRVAQFVGVYIITPAVIFIGRAIEWFFALFYDPGSAPPVGSAGEGEFDVDAEPWMGGVATGDSMLVAAFVLMGILAVIFAILIYRMRKRTLGRKQQSTTKKGLTEARRKVVPILERSSEKDSKHKHSRFTPRDPRMALRNHYRQFLRICAEKGRPPEKADTSEEINSKNKANFHTESMARLRELYIKARYSKHEIKKSESTEAGNLVKNLLSHGEDSK